MRSIMILMIAVNFIFADGVMQIKNGWQLIGVPTTLNVQKSFDNQNVEIVWGFDALSQSWKGYSPDSDKNAKIIQSYEALTTLEPFEALWVFSKNDWQLEYTQEDSIFTPKNSTITLEYGWNLVAIPQEIVVSDKFFGDAIVWKYSEDNEWSVNDENLDFPSIDDIKQSEGLWVKSDETKTINIDQQSSKLQTFESKEAMLNYIRSMIEMNQYYYFDEVMIVLAPVEDTGSSDISNEASNATTTNLQEAGVDEGDILKHDNIHIFSVDNTNEKIIVTSFENIAKKNYTPITSLDFNDKNIKLIYLQNSRLCVVSNNMHVYAYNNEAMEDDLKESDMMIVPYQNTFTLDIFDVSDINNITLISTHTIDGNYQDSRLINGELYLISQFMPNFEYENSIVVDENLLPTITSNSQTPKDLLSPSTFYAPAKLNQSANITTISRFLIDSGEYKANSSFLGNTHTYYATTTSLYLVSNEYPLYYDYTHYKDQQMIYKFSLDETLSYVGRGFVEGSMLNQFSMSEKDDYLRVATTSGWSWWGNGETTNSIYTLLPDDEELVVEGKLTGLGHEGETIRAVRFMGNRGFVVTFRQTDPLYTLDLSDPKEPKAIGELSIPGFSTYLHVIDENRVLSIGRNADDDGRAQELQFGLFDISDFSNPLLADKIEIGDANSYSEAEYNHKAFSYRESDLMFGVPYRNYSDIDYSSSEHFGVYQIDDLNIESVHTLTSDSSDWGNVGRGLIFDLNNTTYGVLLKGSNIICENIK